MIGNIPEVGERIYSHILMHALGRSSMTKRSTPNRWHSVLSGSYARTGRWTLMYRTQMLLCLAMGGGTSNKSIARSWSLNDERQYKFDLLIGNRKCPGRFFATNGALINIATFLAVLDISMDEKEVERFRSDMSPRRLMSPNPVSWAWCLKFLRTCS